MELSEQSSSRTIQVDGHTVHYHDVGQGPSLLLLQAFGPLPGTTSWLTYHRILADFAPHFRCILVDYPNFGRSSPVVFHEPVHDLYVRHVVALLDQLGLEKVTVLGISTGGTVAIVTALAVPDRIAKMVVGGCSASTGGDPCILTPTPTEVGRLFAENQSGDAERSSIERLLRALVYDPTLITDDMVDAMFEWRVKEPQHSAMWSQSTSIPHSNLAALRTIATPMLIVHGRFDRMVPLEQALTLLAHVSTADLVVLNHCGHWAPFERPESFIRSVKAFLME